MSFPHPPLPFILSGPLKVLTSLNIRAKKENKKENLLVKSASVIMISRPLFRFEYNFHIT